MKKINFLKLISLLIVVVFAVSCKDKHPQSQSVNTLIALDKQNVTLHAGESTNISAKVNFQEDGKNVVTTIEKKVNWESADTLVAKVDGNGKVTAVSGGVTIIKAECQGTVEECAILVKDIFVAGMLIDSLDLVTIDTFAVIWQKCDTGAFIKYKVPDAEFAAMVVNEQGIYYAGTEGNVAKVWKDGAKLYELGENNKITSMCIDGGDVYVTGYNTISEDNIVARLWKNGEQQELSEIGNDSYAYDVVVANGNVYVVGKKIRKKETGTSFYDAIVWTNGNAKKLIIPAMTNSKNAEARTICINNGSIYIGGGVDANSKTPYIWENEKESPLVEKMEVGSFVKNLKFINNQWYAFYGKTLLMGNKKSTDTDMKSFMIQAQGSGYADAIESEGAVFIVGQGYPQYANGSTSNIESGYSEKALATILLKDNLQMDFLPRSMRAKAKGEEDAVPGYPKSNAVAIGIR